MDRARFKSHISMWLLIGSGWILAFHFIPPLMLFRPNWLSTLIEILLLVFFIRHIYYSCQIHHRHKSQAKNEMDQIVRAGLYGRFAHPTCTSLVLAFWIYFFIYPDIRLLASVIWTSVLIFLWIETEKECYVQPKAQKDASVDPDL